MGPLRCGRPALAVARGFVQDLLPKSLPIRTRLYAQRINSPLKPNRGVPRVRVRRKPPIALAHPKISAIRLRSFWLV